MALSALARCVGEPGKFLDEAWERKVHLHAGADGAALLSLDDVDGLLAGAALRAPAFRLVKGGAPVPPERYLRSARLGSRTIRDLIDPGRVHALFADGATVVLQGLHRYWPPLTAFCRELERELSHPVQANAYLTPPAATGLRVHADAHDVLALQSHGTKHWVAYPVGSDPADPPAPTLDTYLEQGDCLYVPRGAPHAARTPDTTSLHITLGIRVATWRDALRRAVDEALSDPALSEALPPGYAEDPAALSAQLGTRLQELAARVAKADTQRLADAAVDAFAGGRQPDLTGQLRELVTLDDLDDDTVLARRRGAVARLRSSGERASLLLGDRRVTLPAWTAPMLEWLLGQDELRVGDLSRWLDEPGRLTLARRLVREGLLVRRG